MKCSIIEDLYPLYEENLVHDETKELVEQHLQTCADCAAKFTNGNTQLRAPVEKPKVEASVTVKKTQSRLAIYQLFIMLFSFYFAMSTNIISESFGFILTYFILGLLVFLFYRNWLLTLLIAFLPVFFVAFVDSAFAPNAYRLYKGDHGGGNPFMFLGIHVGGALLIAAIHSIFAMLGGVVGYFIRKIKEVEQ